MQRSTRLVGALAAIAAIALFWWLLRGGAATPDAETAEAKPAQAAQPGSPESAGSGDSLAAPGAAAAGADSTVAEPAGVPAPAHRIPEGGRLSLLAADLPRDGSAFTLGLDLPDAARGNGSRPVRIVSEDGLRELTLTAAPIAGPGSGIALEIDPAWLRPERYLVEVTTAETTHFPLRRYVFELR